MASLPSSIKGVFPRAFLVCAGAVLPLLVLVFGARLFGFPPLSEAEQSGIANYQHLNYDDLGPLCRLNRKFRGGKSQIAVFGGSSVEGAMASEEKDFPTQLQHRLAKRFPGDWSVHNLGRSAKTSFWMKECMKSAAQDKAQYWVAYEGHNDYIDIFGGGVAKTNFLLANPWSYRMLQWLLGSRASGWLRPFIGEARAAHTWAEHQAGLDRVLEISEANYREMIVLAKASGAKLVLATVISNLMYEPWFVALPGTPDNLDASTAFKRANALFSEKKYAEALALYRLARDRDVHMWRAPSSFNDMIRRLAAEFSGDVMLLDLERAMEQEFGKNRQLGCDFFGGKNYCDQLHPNDFTHSWIAAELEKLLFSGVSK